MSGVKGMKHKRDFADPIYSGDLQTYRHYAEQLGISAVCPDFGTRVCLDCELGDGKARDVCDYKCSKCADWRRCACTLAAWRERRARRDCVL